MGNKDLKMRELLHLANSRSSVRSYLEHHSSRRPPLTARPGPNVGLAGVTPL